MATKELSTQQITAMIGMKASQFCLLVNDQRNQFPAPIRIGGVTGVSRFYDREKVLEWIEEWKLKKLDKKSTGVLIKQFLAGKFDREGLKEEYMSKASTARKNAPKTQKIRLNDNSGEIVQNHNYWQGFI